MVISPTRSVQPSCRRRLAGRDEGLTAREAEVLSLITMGLSNAEIAHQLVLSVNSVKSYIRSCYRKIYAESRSHAVLWGVAHGLRPRPLHASESCGAGPPVGHPQPFRNRRRRGSLIRSDGECAA